MIKNQLKLRIRKARAGDEIGVANKASLKLAKKFGFRIEGRKRKAFFTDDGRYIDIYVVGKLL